MVQKSVRSIQKERLHLKTKASSVIIGKNVWLARRRGKITLREAAKALQIHPIELRKIETGHGQSLLTAFSIYSLAEYYQITPKEIFTRRY